MEEEEREALVAKLASLRSKLGFDILPQYRKLPSTREMPMGTGLTVRLANRPGSPFFVAYAHLVNDLEVKIRFMPEKDADAEVPPDFRLGQKVEVFFAHGPRRRCRFSARVTGDPEGDGWTIPLEHVPIETIDLTTDATRELHVEGRFASEQTGPISVLVIELSGVGLCVASPLPEGARRGTISFVLPEDSEACAAEVARPDADREEVGSLQQRCQLRFTAIDDDSRQRVLRFLSQAAMEFQASGA
jgi:hypothetical protein